MSFDADGFHEVASPPDLGRYSPLGLIANPFVVGDDDDDPAVMSEIAAAGNLLLGAILERSREEAPKPLVVLKGDVPSSYPLQAMGSAERSLARDDSLNVLYAYVQLFTMRAGSTRATLNILAERLVFRDFDRLLVSYIESILAEPDTSLPSWGVAGPERLASFAERFESDPLPSVRTVFGEEVLERHQELSQVADLRHVDLPSEAEELDTAEEIDASVGDTPGTPMLLAEAVEIHSEDDRAIFDYFVEYTAVHLSPVIARGLRVHRDRGLAAFAEELKVTKAPRKTMTALLSLAALRYRKAVVIYDGFDAWLEIPSDLRSRVVGALSDLRWKTAGSAFPIFVLMPGEAPELEETFGASGTISWEFPGLIPMQEQQDVFLPDVVSGWLAAAALADASPLTLESAVLSALRDAADGSMSRFVRMARAAIESASDRGVAALDDVAKDAGLAAGSVS